VTTLTVLFVCQANTARSVMAQVFLERLLMVRGVRHVRVRSAGVAPYARDGMLASLDARLALKEVGILLAEDAITSTALTRHPELLAEADLVVTMTSEQTRLVAALDGAGDRPIVTLRELAGGTGDIGDPAGQGEDVFRACRDEIRACLEQALEPLLARLAVSGT
jgi:protein-tyrosine-phosphatase